MTNHDDAPTPRPGAVMGSPATIDPDSVPAYLGYPGDAQQLDVPPEMCETVTNTKAIDFLRSITTTRVERTKHDAPKTRIEHVAYFGIEPGTVEDLINDHSKVLRFEPRFMRAEWGNGLLNSVQLSGPQRLTSGGVSDKLGRRRSFRSRWSYESLDRSVLPAIVSAALTSYETRIAFAAGNERVDFASMSHVQSHD